MINLLKRFFKSNKKKVDTFERAISWDDFIGNDVAKERLRITIEASIKSSTRLPNILLYGPAGCGKTTLARIVANSLNANFIEMTGSSLRTQEDLLRVVLGSVKTTKKATIIFIDEIHGVVKSRLPEDIWLPLLEQNILYHSCGRKYLDVGGKIVRVSHDPIHAPNVTWIGATTDPGLLHPAFRRRFPVTISLTDYTFDDIVKMVNTYCTKENISIEQKAVELLASRSRRTPAIAIHHLLRQALDLALLEHVGGKIHITEDHARRAAELAGFGFGGVRDEDVKVLRALYQGMPHGLGVKSLSASTNIPINILTEMVLPFLQSEGLVCTTHRRVLTPQGRHFYESLACHREGGSTHV